VWGERVGKLHLELGVKFLWRSIYVGWCRRSYIVIFFVVTTPFNAKRTMTTMMCYFSAMSLFFVLLQCNSMVKKTMTQNFPHRHFIFFCCNATHSYYLHSVLVLCFALVLFLVSAIAQLWWSLFCIYVLFVFGRRKLKRKRGLMPPINKHKLVLKMWLHWLWVGMWRSECKLVLMLEKHLQ